MIRKAYIDSWKKRVKPEERDITDYTFDYRPERALHWDTRQDAENDCVLFNRWGIVIDLAGGGKHVCKSFKVEELASGEFAVFCEAPFPGAESGTVSQSTAPK